MKQTLFAIWLHLALGAGGLASLILKESLHQQNRIYGGTFATKNQYPFVVVSFTMPGPIVSGGAIISEKYIVTTAQHIYNSDEILFVYLYLGAHYYPELSEDSRQNIFLFADELKTASFIHEEFDPETLANNIALIKLTETVEFGATIQKINLPPHSVTAKSLEGSTATLMGWGASEENPDTEDYPRHVNVTLMPQAICNHYYPSLNRSLMLCSDGEMNKGACEGDIGTPLIATLDDDSTVLIGIVSFINSLGCTARWPTMYINVVGYLDWIQENMVES